jgi:GAF domain-containing protein
MEPIVESLDALMLRSDRPDADVLAHLRCAAAHVVEALPECVGMTIARFSGDVTRTVVATSEPLRILDAAQYLAGGPCEFAARQGAEVDVPDVLDEDCWPVFALACSRVGVKSSLALPLRHGRQLLGSVNLFGNTPDTFCGRERELPVMFGAVVELLLQGALPCGAGRTSPSDDAGPDEALDRAAAMVASSEGVCRADARTRLLLAAERAGVGPEALVQLVLEQASHF